MARISGIDLPKNKRIEIGLTYLYGIGLSSSQKILDQAKVDANTRCKDLSDEDISLIRSIIDEHYIVEGLCRRIESMSVKRLMEINCVKGRRHRATPKRGYLTNASTN